MPTTPNRNYPFPTAADAARVPRDLGDALGMVDADVQNTIDEVGARVRGFGVTDLWLGTQDEYDALAPDPTTVYIITNASDVIPDVGQALGVAATSSLATSTATSIVPTLPAIAQEWGYLAIIVGQNTISGQQWVAPAGWTRIADQSDTDGGFSSRPMAIFKAPAGTSTMAFASPGGGSQRYVAAVFPVKLEPISRGFIDAAGATTDFFTAPSMVYTGPAIPVTIATSNLGDAVGSNLPSLSTAQYNIGSGPALINGTGSVTMLHIHVGSDPVMATPSQGFTLSQPMGSSMSAWRLGVGS